MKFNIDNFVEFYFIITLSYLIESNK